MEDIRVGDVVRVTDWGYMYDTNRHWIMEKYEEGGIPLDYVARYAYGNDKNYLTHKYDDDTEYKVVYVFGQKVLICEEGAYTEIYMLDASGIELYYPPTEMTIAEIEEKLGVSNLRIVEG